MVYLSARPSCYFGDFHKTYRNRWCDKIWNENWNEIIIIICCGAATQRGSWPPHSWDFQITHNDAPHSVGLLWTGDQLVAETSTWQHTTLTTDKHPCPPVGFEPTISAGERPQTYVLDRAVTGTGKMRYWPSSMRIPNPGFKQDIQHCTGVILKEIILLVIKHDISILTLILLTWRKWWANNASK